MFASWSFLLPGNLSSLVKGRKGLSACSPRKLAERKRPQVGCCEESRGLFIVRRANESTSGGQQPEAA
jgi:hypothetical protein